MIAARHVKDAAPRLAPLHTFVVRRTDSPLLIASLQGKRMVDMMARFDAGHRAYVAWYDGEPAAFGWVATRSADIGELQVKFTLPSRDRYLWNFVTQPGFRGLGIYPRLLAAIVDAERAEADRFWIIAAPENHASESGIVKAGFTTLAELSFDGAGRPAVRAMVAGGGTAAAALLGVPEISGDLAQCWRCARAGNAMAGCASGSCRCDYQKKEQACAA
jgi:ribosomal protein S18 acetylase RimI-like enzyme